jgi:molybdate transport system regulatory protein
MEHVIKKSKPAGSLALHIRLQIAGREKIALGPGKVELLVLLDETGSISEAARRMKMSYMKAWSLIQTMKPLVESTRGGPAGGGAKLTADGCKAVALYQKMERDSRRACQGSWKKLQGLFPA